MQSQMISEVCECTRGVWNERERGKEGASEEGRGGRRKGEWVVLLKLHAYTRRRLEDTKAKLYSSLPPSSLPFSFHPFLPPSLPPSHHFLSIQMLTQ